ncbi:hypothetical protein WAI453_009108 [Rhynchosporium graminicola]
MARFINYLTLIPTIFTPSNVGGVNPESGSKYEPMQEQNSAFSLLKVGRIKYLPAYQKTKPGSGTIPYVYRSDNQVVSLIIYF